MFREMRRYKQQAHDEECVEILTSEGRGVLSVVGDDGYPYGVPVDYIYEDGHIYIHSAKEGHKIDALRVNSKACFTVMNHGYKNEGEWFWNITSVICFGRATLVEDPETTERFTRKIGEKYFPTADILEKEMLSVGRVQLIDFAIEHMSGKHIREK